MQIAAALTDAFLDPLFLAGSQRQLTPRDLPAVPAACATEPLAAAFDAVWRRRRRQLHSASAPSTDPTTTNTTAKPPPPPTTTTTTTTTTSRRPLLSALLATHGAPYAAAGVFRLAADAAAVASPLVLRAIVTHVDRERPAAADAGGRSQWAATATATGVALVALFFALQLLQTVAVNAHLRRTMRVGFLIRTQLMAAIYNKALVLSPLARSEFSDGKIVNLMETDPARVELSTGSLHVLYSAPLMILAATGILYASLGVSGLFGFAFLAAYVPLQARAMKAVAMWRRKTTAISDSRVNVIKESLSGMVMVKLSQWEKVLLDRIFKLRDQETALVKLYLVFRASIAGITQIVPMFALFCALFSWSFLHGWRLPDPPIIFSSMSLFFSLRVPLILLPQVLTQATDAAVSLERIQSFLLADEVEEATQSTTPARPLEDLDVHVENADFRWTSSPPTAAAASDAKKIFSLRNIDLSVKRGELVAVVGTVASGKSSLLAALAGELPIANGGRRRVGGRVAVCPNPAWIVNATVKENILFGAALDRDRLSAVVDACALGEDLSAMAKGEETEIGEKGFNLSGGQRVRVALARAAYSAANVLLLDDPFGAVDAHVAKHILERCILGFLRGRTRIVTTHSVHLLPNFDRVVVLSDGCIVESGTFDELASKRGGALARMLSEDAANGAVPAGGERKSAVGSGKAAARAAAGPVYGPEERIVVSRATLWAYFRFAGGWPTMAVVAVFMTLTQVARVVGDRWLSSLASSSSDAKTLAGLLLYLCFGLLQVASIIAQGFAVASAGVLAAKRLHAAAVGGVFSAPISFTQTNPVGRIVSRFSKDVDDVDNFLPEALRIALFTMSLVLASLFSIAALSPTFLASLLPGLAVFYWLQGYYRKTSKQIKRLENILRSGVTAHLSETLSGLPTIRAFDAKPAFAQKFAAQLDSFNRAGYLFFHMQRWLSVRMETTAAVLIGSAAALLVLAPHAPPAAGAAGNNGNNATAGLVLAYSLQITASLTWWVRQLSESERMMMAVERLRKYAALPAEEQEQVATAAAENKESRGERRVEFDRLTVDYATGGAGPPRRAVADVSFSVAPGAALGIVGRTGAGKSTLVAALARLVAPASGGVRVDGVDVRAWSLRELRRAVFVVPQDPVLFSGSVRWNLDPEGAREDDALWTALRKVGLEDVVKQLPGGLNAEVKEAGRNWSTGQRQLLCLARAALLAPRVLVLDEATSSTDAESEARIRDAVLPMLSGDDGGCALVVVAHRVTTVARLCERVVVLDAGRVVEEGAVASLMLVAGGGGGRFAALVREAGEGVWEAVEAAAKAREGKK
ncbi:P-loop containing nucleoside triphosphate hydrolase protein [Zopfochytrium polystomum]|nr:P-loop containing nucleoside triphosphate hydrolase protein [Zopfochytrium polystomum]